jgi:hypothetical protein
VLDAPLDIRQERGSASPDESAGSVAPQEVVEPEQAVTPVVEPDEPVKAPVKKKHIVQYTIKSCIWCKRDVEKVIPRWVKAGWQFDPQQDVIDETTKPKPGGYPRYEIYDAQGKVTIHHGSLISLKP